MIRIGVVHPGYIWWYIHMQCRLRQQCGAGARRSRRDGRAGLGLCVRACRQAGMCVRGMRVRALGCSGGEGQGLDESRIRVCQD